tara:strand:+ start:479 stop:730 length:252 start_codon:yes stop_codon:yes gene_type:complete
MLEQLNSPFNNFAMHTTMYAMYDESNKLIDSYLHAHIAFKLKYTIEADGNKTVGIYNTYYTDSVFRIVSNRFYKGFIDENTRK